MEESIDTIILELAHSQGIIKGREPKDIPELGDIREQFTRTASEAFSGMSGHEMSAFEILGNACSYLFIKGAESTVLRVYSEDGNISLTFDVGRFTSLEGIGASLPTKRLREEADRMLDVSAALFDVYREWLVGRIREHLLEASEMEDVVRAAFGQVFMVGVAYAIEQKLDVREQQTHE